VQDTEADGVADARIEANVTTPEGGRVMKVQTNLKAGEIKVLRIDILCSQRL